MEVSLAELQHNCLFGPLWTARGLQLQRKKGQIRVWERKETKKRGTEKRKQGYSDNTWLVCTVNQYDFKHPALKRVLLHTLKNTDIHIYPTNCLSITGSSFNTGTGPPFTWFFEVGWAGGLLIKSKTHRSDDHRYNKVCLCKPDYQSLWSTNKSTLSRWS